MTEPSPDRVRAIELKKAGYSTIGVANILGVGHQTILELLKGEITELPKPEGASGSGTDFSAVYVEWTGDPTDGKVDVVRIPSADSDVWVMVKVASKERVAGNNEPWGFSAYVSPEGDPDHPFLGEVVDEVAFATRTLDASDVRLSITFTLQFFVPKGRSYYLQGDVFDNNNNPKVYEKALN